MGTNYVYHSPAVGVVLTTNLIAVTTGAPQKVVALGSGTVLINFQNLGPNGSITLGDSSMAMGSGDTVFPYASREFYPVNDNFVTYARANSAASNLSVTEYGVA